jgi:excisionase family DNA binding protein
LSHPPLRQIINLYHLKSISKEIKREVVAGQSPFRNPSFFSPELRRRLGNQPRMSLYKPVRKVARLMHLGRALSAVWNDPASSIDIKKRITRTVIRVIVVRVEDDRLHGMIHWHGGDHTALEVAIRVRGRWRDTREANTEAETAALITALVRTMPDSSIAAVLNRLGKRTISGLSWTAGRVQLFRNDHHLLAYREGERHDRGELMLTEVSQELGISKMTVIRMIHTKTLPARQVCPGAPYVILRQDLELPGVRSAPPRSPVSSDERAP